MSPRLLHLSAAITATSLLAAAIAQAQPSRDDLDSVELEPLPPRVEHAQTVRDLRGKWSGALRITLPFQGHAVVNGDERTESVGLGIALAALLDGTWSAQVGVGWRGTSKIGMSYFHMRVGVTPTLLAVTDLEGGWTINAGPWLGYEQQWRTEVSGDYDLTERVGALTQTLTLDVTRWWPDGNGLSFQLYAGQSVALVRSESHDWSEQKSAGSNFHHSFDLGGSVGWSF
ncbi:MAG: hypothetical protein R3B13_27070 [Polyangiaceae bacterium]